MGVGYRRNWLICTFDNLLWCKEPIPGPRALWYGPSRAQMGPGLPKGQWPISIATLNDGKYTALFKNGLCTGLRLSSQFKFQMASVVYTTVCPMFTPTYIGCSLAGLDWQKVPHSDAWYANGVLVNLHWLMVNRWNSVKFPSWIGAPLLCSMEFIHIYTWLVDGTAMPISFLLGTDEIPMFKPGCP